MSKRDVILARFPDFMEAQDTHKLLYQIVGTLAAPLERLDRQLAEMMWAHWVNRARDLRDLEGLAALYGVRRFDGEPRERLRERFKALVRITLGGTATPAAVLQVVAATLGLDIWDEALRPRLESGETSAVTLARAAGYTLPLALVETPWKAVEPAPISCVNGQRLALHQDDFESVVPTLVIVGMGGRTVAPSLTNLTQGQVIGYLDTVPDGQRLVIAPDAETGLARARLAGRDVSSRVYSLQGGFYDRDTFGRAQARFVARRPQGAFGVAGEGTPDYTFATRAPQAQMPSLPYGDSEWCASAAIGRFGRAAWGRCAWDVPDPEVYQQGRYQRTPWDASFFELLPSLQVALRWQERERATVEVRVPWTLVQRGPDRIERDRWAYEVHPESSSLALRQIERLRFGLYARTVAPGQTVKLGGNAAPGARGTTTGYWALVGARSANVSSLDESHAQIGLARRGSAIYLDDSDTVLEQPPTWLDSMTLVRTAHADEPAAGADVVALRLRTTEEVTLYVAYDALAAALPNWLRTGWTKLEQTVEATRERVVYRLPLGRAPCTGVWLERTGTPPLPPPRLLVADATLGALYVLDPVRLQRLARGDADVTTASVVLATVPVGQGACSIALLTHYRPPDLAEERNLVYVAASEANQVTVVDLDLLESLIVDPTLSPSRAVVAEIPCGQGPAQVNLTPDQNEAQVVNLLDHTITRVDLGTNQAVETLEATLPHERIMQEVERVRAAGIRTRVVYTVAPLAETLAVAAQASSTTS